MVGLIYFTLVFVGLIAHTVKIVSPEHMDRPPQAASFDANKDCETVYINSPVDYYAHHTVHKSCAIGVLTYPVHGETVAASTIDPSQSVPSVLEINGTK